MMFAFVLIAGSLAAGAAVLMLLPLMRRREDSRPAAAITAGVTLFALLLGGGALYAAFSNYTWVEAPAVADTPAAAAASLAKELAQNPDRIEGWLDLGNHVEADNELERLPYDQRTAPDVLRLRCRIYEKAGKWDYLSILAKGFYEATPSEEFLLHFAWAEYKLGNVHKAAVLLLHESGRFPESAEVAYRVACLLAVLGRIAEARDWLSKAFELSLAPDKLKLRALEDPELEKLWREEPPHAESS